MSNDTKAPERVAPTKGKGRYYKANRQVNPLVRLLPLLGRTINLMTNVDPATAPSVTTILGALAKPALIGWAAREERKMVSALASDLYTRLNEVVDGSVTPKQFQDMLEDELGKGAHLKLMAKAANVGTEVHARIEWEFKGELGLERPEQPPALTSVQAERSFTRWQEWRAQVHLRVLGIERMLFCSMFGFGGTLDLLAEMDHPTETVQLDGGEVAPRRMVVVLDFKTGKHIYGEAHLQNVAYRMALLEEGVHTDGGMIVRLPKYDNDPEFDAQPVPDDPTLAPTFIALRLVYTWFEKDHQKKPAPRKSKGSSDPNKQGQQKPRTPTASGVDKRKQA